MTDRVRLGTQVASPNFRHPVPFAKELMTLDQLTGGRLELGVGVGTEGPDARVLGQPPLSRRGTRRPLRRVARAARPAAPRPGDDGARRAVHRGRRPPAPGVRAAAAAAVHGRRRRAPGAAAGRPVRPALGHLRPLRCGGRARGVVRRGGRAVARLTDALAEEGREPASLRRSAQLGLETSWPFESADRYADTLGRLAEAGIDEVGVHWPRPTVAGCRGPRCRSWRRRTAAEPSTRHDVVRGQVPQKVR